MYPQKRTETNSKIRLKIVGIDGVGGNGVGRGAPGRRIGILKKTVISSLRGISGFLSESSEILPFVQNDRDGKDAFAPAWA